MALQSLANGMGVLIDSVFMRNAIGQTPITLDATGESVALLGEVYIEGEAASKTISAAGGGKIFFRTSSPVTFANAGTNFRVGIQDLAASGLEDGTYDVYADFVGGGGGIAANTWYEKAMSSGSKTINHLDEVAIICELTSRAGADSVNILCGSSNTTMTSNSHFPYRTTDSGAGPARAASSMPIMAIVFDDGTMGWIRGAVSFPGINAVQNSTYNSGSAADEYAAVFQVPYKCSINAAYMYVASIASTDNFEIVLYSDAEGTPVAERTVVCNPNYTGGTSTTPAPYEVSFSEYTLSPGLWYALAMRPTTANNLVLGYIDMTSSMGNKYKKVLPFGTNCKYSNRANQTGAFSEVQRYYQPMFGIYVNKLDDGVSSGGEHSFTF